MLPEHIANDNLIIPESFISPVLTETSYYITHINYIIDKGKDCHLHDSL